MYGLDLPTAHCTGPPDGTWPAKGSSEVAISVTVKAHGNIPSPCEAQLAQYALLTINNKAFLDNEYAEHTTITNLCYRYTFCVKEDTS
ncbi:hypothetical protein J6590_039753 [Homalodisca vitripennis]|nr:hypothetical protein J6590_039753 [Homalodisca vitripennis]